MKKIRSLAARKHRDAEGLFLAEGLDNIIEAVRRGWHIHTLVMESGVKPDSRITGLILGLKKQGRPCLEVPGEIMGTLTRRDNAREALAVLEQKWTAPEDIGTAALPYWVALEKIRDPGNLGTIIRTASAVGVQGIILVGETCDPYSIESVRASAGSFARMLFVKTSRDQFVSAVRQCGYKMIGTHLKAAMDYKNADYAPPGILVMGNEQAGLSDTLAGACTSLVKIPMIPGTESLNVAIATGILLYEVFHNANPPADRHGSQRLHKHNPIPG